MCTSGHDAVKQVPSHPGARTCGEVLKAAAELGMGMCLRVYWCVCSYQHMYTFIKLHLLLPLKFYEHRHMVLYPATECVCVCVRVHVQAGLLGTHSSSG